MEKEPFDPSLINLADAERPTPETAKQVDSAIVEDNVNFLRAKVVNPVDEPMQETWLINTRTGEMVEAYESKDPQSAPAENPEIISCTFTIEPAGYRNAVHYQLGGKLSPEAQRVFDVTMHQLSMEYKVNPPTPEIVEKQAEARAVVRENAEMILHAVKAALQGTEYADFPMFVNNETGKISLSASRPPAQFGRPASAETMFRIIASTKNNAKNLVADDKRGVSHIGEVYITKSVAQAKAMWAKETP